MYRNQSRKGSKRAFYIISFTNKFYIYKLIFQLQFATGKTIICMVPRSSFKFLVICLLSYPLFDTKSKYGWNFLDESQGVTNFLLKFKAYQPLHLPGDAAYFSFLQQCISILCFKSTKTHCDLPVSERSIMILGISSKYPMNQFSKKQLNIKFAIRWTRLLNLRIFCILIRC